MQAMLYILALASTEYILHSVLHCRLSVSILVVPIPVKVPMSRKVLYSGWRDRPYMAFPRGIPLQIWPDIYYGVRVKLRGG